MLSSSLARVSAWLPAALALVALSSPSASGQVGPEESARKLKPAEGLEATLFAAEPMVINPTNIDVDSRGRVWVCEGLNYRYTLHREQPYLENADAIKVLEDTDGDGKADKVTIFADKIFPVPMGIAVEEVWDGKTYKGCRVYIGNSPDVLVLEDTDGDDKADKRYPLLTGFGGYDHDHGVHGMVLGPDGKLYLTQGDGARKAQPGERGGQFEVVDKSGRRVFNDQLGSTLRVNRDGTQFEVLADRHRNDYETSLDSFGHVFTSDNDDDGNRGSRVIWVMDGGRYGYRTPGSPRHWGEDVPGNVPKLVGTGNGSPCGLMVYEGSLLPRPFQGAVLEAEAGPRVIYAFPITRKGAAFRTEIQTLLASDDPWFRPVDVTAAPDGSVFVADWYDAGVGGHAFRDQTTGRIYRVAPKGHSWKKPVADFGSVEGLIAALNSPNVATRDVARRKLMERGKDAVQALKAQVAGDDPIGRARALWLLAELDLPSVIAALKHGDPQVRELAVRILGRDNRENGQVTYERPEAKLPPPAKRHLLHLVAVAHDPDAGVRRELVLALRNMPTSDVGEALRSLAAAWDGQDRWYLEALGLALRHREPEYLAKLFDGALYGPLDLAESGQASKVALPPYFPIDRNEAFLATSDADGPPATPLSKTIGLAWEVHRVEVLPLLARLMPGLRSPEMQQAADAILTHVTEPSGAIVLAKLAGQLTDPLRQRAILATLARKLESSWKSAAGVPEVVAAVESALANPALRAQGLLVASATGEKRYTEAVAGLIDSPTANPDERAGAVDALARINPERAKAVLEGLITKARERKATDPAAEAALRNLPRLIDARARLFDMIGDESVPLGMRRVALRTYAGFQEGGPKLLEMARAKAVPESLRGEATAVLHGHADRRVREEAVKVLPLTSASGKPLPPLFELLRREGDAGRGRAVFFATKVPKADGGQKAVCGSCHRVQGRGQWVGPDLSTIGTKYGKDEMLRSLLNPSAAIGYNYVTTIIALKDGQVITGLPVEDTPERLVLKTAEGRRVVVPPGEIEERASSEVSLMPEGLAQSMTEQELVDLLAFLDTLKAPVSVVGQFQAIGPTTEAVESRPPADRARKGRPITADAEGRVDLGALLKDDPKEAVYLITPVTTGSAIEATLVIDTKADARAWLDGKALDLTSAGEGPLTARLVLPKGTSELLVRLAGGAGESAVVATIVADRPVEFAVPSRPR